MISKITALFLIILFLLTGCNKKEDKQQNEQESQKVLKEKKSEENIINLSTIENKTIKLTAIKEGIIFENYKGKIILLDFFATWCPPCLAEIPHLNAIQTSYQDQVQLIGILMEENKSNDEMENFKFENSITFPITNSPANFQLSQALGGIESLPTMVMYDKNGEYFNHYIGAVPQEMIESDIKKALLK